ncbi:MAG: hypothetical protein HRT47_08175 [Candidatus Caenarcaniphilales bacterium]|nr:hypothetical protein [Candidatus Caenarcaniphilales bacterium]
MSASAASLNINQDPLVPLMPEGIGQKVEEKQKTVLAKMTSFLHNKGDQTDNGILKRLLHSSSDVLKTGNSPNGTLKKLLLPLSAASMGTNLLRGTVLRSNPLVEKAGEFFFRSLQGLTAGMNFLNGADTNDGAQMLGSAWEGLASFASDPYQTKAPGTAIRNGNDALIAEKANNIVSFKRAEDGLEEEAVQNPLDRITATAMGMSKFPAELLGSLKEVFDDQSLDLSQKVKKSFTDVLLSGETATKLGSLGCGISFALPKVAKLFNVDPEKAKFIAHKNRDVSAVFFDVGMMHPKNLKAGRLFRFLKGTGFGGGSFFDAIGQRALQQCSDSFANLTGVISYGRNELGRNDLQSIESLGDAMKVFWEGISGSDKAHTVENQEVDLANVEAVTAESLAKAPELKAEVSVKAKSSSPDYSYDYDSYDFGPSSAPVSSSKAERTFTPEENETIRKLQEETRKQEAVNDVDEEETIEDEGPNFFNGPPVGSDGADFGNAGDSDDSSGPNFDNAGDNNDSGGPNFGNADDEKDDDSKYA